MIDPEISMHASDEEALQDYKRKRNEHWLRMRRAREYWMTKHKIQSLDDTFWRWLEDSYGLSPNRDNFGNITEGYNIVNEKLYTVFLLKFSQ